MLQKDNYPSQAFAAGSYFAGAVLSGAFDQDQQKSRERDLVLRVSTINNFLGVDRLSLDAKQSHRGFSELNKKKWKKNGRGHDPAKQVIVCDFAQSHVPHARAGEKSPSTIRHGISETVAF